MKHEEQIDNDRAIGSVVEIPLSFILASLTDAQKGRLLQHFLIAKELKESNAKANSAKAIQIAEKYHASLSSVNRIYYRLLPILSE